MKEACKICDINQMLKISKIMDLSPEDEAALKQSVEDYLKGADMNKTNPEVMGEIWNIVAKISGCMDPYREIKNYYNNEVLKIAPLVNKLIGGSPKPLDTALKIAISGNLIDFAAKHEFNIDILMNKVKEVCAEMIAIDDSTDLFEELKSAKTLLYLGDNCGEIVLDKIFIEVIEKYYPNIKVYYGVRGLPIVNDVTKEDAEMAGMEEVATVVSNGDGSLGTVLKKANDIFNNVFTNANVVICKGQGNYESLLGNRKENIFFLFMAKCEIVAQPLHIPIMSNVCLKNRIDLKW